MRSHPRYRSRTLAAGIAAATLAFAASAVAQNTVEELTVTGHGPHATKDTMSYVVGFSDLNLREEAGRNELHNRIKISASYVCRKLGEKEVNSIPECESHAAADAMSIARKIEHQVLAHSGRLTPGHPWTPPPKD